MLQSTAQIGYAANIGRNHKHPSGCSLNSCPVVSLVVPIDARHKQGVIVKNWDKGHEAVKPHFVSVIAPWGGSSPHTAQLRAWSTHITIPHTWLMYATCKSLIKSCGFKDANIWSYLFSRTMALRTLSKPILRWIWTEPLSPSSLRKPSNTTRKNPDLRWSKQQFSKTNCWEGLRDALDIYRFKHSTWWWPTSCWKICEYQIHPYVCWQNWHVGQITLL